MARDPPANRLYLNRAALKYAIGINTYIVSELQYTAPCSRDFFDREPTLATVGSNSMIFSSEPLQHFETVLLMQACRLSRGNA